MIEIAMTSELKAGDFVKFKGGGPLMMIKEVIAPEGNILCVWFAGLP
jgi:uncharacterized protein YodC (DUF2158 family)